MFRDLIFRRRRERRRPGGVDLTYSPPVLAARGNLGATSSSAQSRCASRRDGRVRWGAGTDLGRWALCKARLLGRRKRTPAAPKSRFRRQLRRHGRHRAASLGKSTWRSTAAGSCTWWISAGAKFVSSPATAIEVNSAANGTATRRRSTAVVRARVCAQPQAHSQRAVRLETAFCGAAPGGGELLASD
jgi:hypothetical protein